MDKIYHNQKLSVPQDLVTKVIMAQHLVMGHTGVEKLIPELKARYAFPPFVDIKVWAKAVRPMCVTCQVSEHPNWALKGPITMSHVPERIMSSVCLDIFHLPLTTYRDQSFDSLVFCVGRLSGWILAKPALGKGLTAEKTAHLLLENGWDIFGVPSLIACDQGPQFAGQWFRTICARLGIRLAYSQAYGP